MGKLKKKGTTLALNGLTQHKCDTFFMSSQYIHMLECIFFFKCNYLRMHYCWCCQLNRPELLKALCILSPLRVMQVWCKLNYRANISHFTSCQPDQCRAAFSWNLKPREFFPNGINRLDCWVKMEHKNSPHSYTAQPASAKSPVFILLGWRPVHHRPLKEQSCLGQCKPENAQCNPIHSLGKNI